MTNYINDDDDDDDPNRLHSNWIPKSTNTYNYEQRDVKKSGKIPALIVDISDLSRI